MKKFLIVFLFILVAGYALIWVASVNIYANFAQSIVNADNQITTIDGFPLQPRLTFSGEYIFKDGSKVTTSALEIKGFPFPAQRLSVRAPKGLSFRAGFWVSDVTLDQLDIHFQIPLRMPRNDVKADWQAWQATGDGIEIDTLYAKIGDFTIAGSDGLLQLDPNLEWQGAMTTRLTGSDQFVMNLAEQGMMPAKAAIMLQNFLQFLTRTDETTGERFIQTSVQMRKNTVYLGPVRVTEVPKLELH